MLKYNIMFYNSIFEQTEIHQVFPNFYLNRYRYLYNKCTFIAARVFTNGTTLSYGKVGVSSDV